MEMLKKKKRKDRNGIKSHNIIIIKHLIKIQHIIKKNMDNNKIIVQEQDGIRHPLSYYYTTAHTVILAIKLSTLMANSPARTFM